MIDVSALRNIPIGEYLEAKGFEAVSSQGGRLWFHSPLREGDAHPSFVVHPEKNRWYDFALGEGGSVIDLALRMEPGKSYLEVLRGLQGWSGIAVRMETGLQARPLFAPPGGFRLDSIVPVGSLYRLTAYLRLRGIDPCTAEKGGVKAAFYRNGRGGRRFALAFANDRGGYELRNPDFKGTLGPKALSTRAGRDSAEMAVFEGFFDYLSFLTLEPSYAGSALILNSTALAKEAVAALSMFPSFSTVRLYLDNDPAGDEAARLFKCHFEEHPGVRCVDAREGYASCNDLNDFLRTRMESVARPAPLPNPRHKGEGLGKKI